MGACTFSRVPAQSWPANRRHIAKSTKQLSARTASTTRGPRATRTSHAKHGSAATKAAHHDLFESLDFTLSTSHCHRVSVAGFVENAAQNGFLWHRSWQDTSHTTQGSAGQCPAADPCALIALDGCPQAACSLRQVLRRPARQGQCLADPRSTASGAAHGGSHPFNTRAAHNGDRKVR